MEDVIWERLNKLDTNDLNFIHYYSLDVELNYSDIETLYKNYLSKHYFESQTESSIFSDNDAESKEAEITDTVSEKKCIPR